MRWRTLRAVGCIVVEAIVISLLAACSQAGGSTASTNLDTPAYINTPVATNHAGLVISKALYKDPLIAAVHGHWAGGPYCYFADDGFHFDDLGPYTKDIYTCTPMYWPVGDATVTVQVKQVAGNTVDDGFGVIFAMQQANGQDAYGFEVTANGVWTFVKWTGIAGNDGVASEIVAPTKSDVINKGLNVTNTLSLTRHGADFTFAVNGVKVGHAQDTSYNVGYVALFTDYGIHVIFKDIVVTVST